GLTHQSQNLPKRVNSRNGRGALNIPGTSRARLQKLASLPVVDILATAKQLRDSGNDATVRSIVREITQGDKKTRRSERERELGRRQLRLTADCSERQARSRCSWGTLPRSRGRRKTRCSVLASRSPHRRSGGIIPIGNALYTALGTQEEW